MNSKTQKLDAADLQEYLHGLRQALLEGYCAPKKINREEVERSIRQIYTESARATPAITWFSNPVICMKPAGIIQPKMPFEYQRLKINAARNVDRFWNQPLARKTLTRHSRSFGTLYQAVKSSLCPGKCVENWRRDQQELLKSIKEKDWIGTYRM